MFTKLFNKLYCRNLNIVECKGIDKEIDNTVQDCRNLNIVECKVIASLSTLMLDNMS